MFLAFYFLPDFFHRVEVNPAHFQAARGHNPLNFAKASLEFNVRFLQGGFRFYTEVARKVDGCLL